MSVIFQPGQTLGQGDLDIFLTNSGGNPANAYSITYAIFYVAPPDPPGTEVLIGSPTRIPINPNVGEYYASLQIPSNATPGNYRIRWTFQQFASSPPQQVVQEWGVVAPGSIVGPTTYTPLTQGMIDKLRLLLRDQNPDKFYHFRPPETEANINNYNRVFGQVWEDAELYEYLERGLDWWNMMPPNTTLGLNTIDLLVTVKPEWRTAVLWEAIAHACFAVSLNWVVDEFDYSIGGVSLSIEKSAKYESLKQNAESQFDKAAAAKERTVKFMRGIQQPKYGIGIRSAFGPQVGRGVLSPRNFL
jgi:hypothetical protein